MDMVSLQTVLAVVGSAVGLPTSVTPLSPVMPSRDLERLVTSWGSAVSGDWSDPTRWAGGVPSASTDVIITATGQAYTSSITSAIGVRNLLLESVDAELRIGGGGVLDIGEAFTAASGRLRFDGGTIRGGRLVLDPAVVQRYSSSAGNTLDGVEVVGDLVLDDNDASMRLANGTTVSGVVRMDGRRVTLRFAGDQVFDSEIQQSDTHAGVLLIEGGSTLTLGANALVAAVRADIGGETSGGPLGTLVNHGTMRALSSAGFGLRVLSLDRFENAGAIIVDDNAEFAVAESTAVFSNTGSVTVGSGATAEIAAGAWTNAGTVSVGSGGVLRLAGSFGTVGSGLVDGRIMGAADAVLELAGTIDNAGVVLSPGAFGGSMVLDGGTISGGVLDLTSATFGFSDAAGNTLSGVAVLGDLSLSGQGSRVVLRDGATVSGDVLLSGAGSRIGLEGDRSFSNAIVQTSSSGGDIDIGGGGTLTLESSASLGVVRSTIDGLNTFGQHGLLMNEGSISVNAGAAEGLRVRNLSVFANGGTIAVGAGARLSVLESTEVFANTGTITVGAGGTAEIGAASWDNAGSIAANGGSLVLSGSYSSLGAGFGTGRLTGTSDASLRLAGTLDNAGHTLRSTDFGGLITIDGSTISGGALELEGLAFGQSTTSRLDGVDVRGDLVLDAAWAKVVFAGGSIPSGEIQLNAYAARVSFAGPATFNGRITAADGVLGFVGVESNSHLTLGTSADVSFVRGGLGPGGVVGATQITNLGTIRARARMNSSDSVTISVLDAFTNAGLIEVGEGSRFEVSSGVTNFANSGSVAVRPGGDFRVLASSWSNDGQITAVNGLIRLGGTFTTEGSGINAGRIGGDADSTVLLVGTLDNRGAIFRPEVAGAADFRLGGGTILGGELDLTGPSGSGFAAEPQSGVLDGVQVRGDLVRTGNGGSLALRNGTQVSGTISLQGGKIRFDGIQGFNGSIQQAGAHGAVILGSDSELILSASARVTGTSMTVSGEGGGNAGHRLVNDGIMTAIGSSQSGFTFSGVGEVINNGVLAAIDGAQLEFNNQVNYFENNGTLVAGPGSSVEIRSDRWSNNGMIQATSGTVVLGGEISIADTGLAEGRLRGDAASTLRITTNLDNTGHVLRASDFGGTIDLVAARIKGGAIDMSGGGLTLSAAGNQLNVLEDVQVLGDLRLSGVESAVAIFGSTAVSGRIVVQEKATVAFWGSRQWDRDVEQLSADRFTMALQNHTAFTLAAGTTITGNNIVIEGASSSEFLNEGMLKSLGGIGFGRIGSVVNNGLMHAEADAGIGTGQYVGMFVNDGVVRGESRSTITLHGLQVVNAAGGLVETAGGTINLQNATNLGEVRVDSGELHISGSWVNSGLVSGTNASVRLAAVASRADTGLFNGRIVLDGASQVSIEGVIDNAGGEFRASDMTVSGASLSGATIRSGTVVFDDAAKLSLRSGTFDQVAIVGDLDLAEERGHAELRNGATLSGNVKMSGADVLLVLSTDQSQINYDITQTAGRGDVRFSRDEQFQLEATNAIVGQSLVIGGRGDLLIRGTVSANGLGDGVRMSDIDDLTNMGVFEAINGGKLFVNRVKNFTNLVDGRLVDGIYRIGSDSLMDFRSYISENAATIMLLDEGASVFGLEALADNDGTLVLANRASLVTQGDLDLRDGVLRIEIGTGVGALWVPLLDVAGIAQLGGELVLDFTGIDPTDGAYAGQYTFLDAAQFVGLFTNTTLLGIDPMAIDLDASGGTFTLLPGPAPLVPGPGVLATSAMAGLFASRRQRKNGPLMREQHRFAHSKSSSHYKN